MQPCTTTPAYGPYNNGSTKPFRWTTYYLHQKGLSRRGTITRKNKKRNMEEPLIRLARDETKIVPIGSHHPLSQLGRPMVDASDAVTKVIVSPIAVTRNTHTTKTTNPHPEYKEKLDT